MNPTFQKRFSAPAARRSEVAAFTLIEMIVVIGIIGLLAALVIPVAGAVNRKAKLTRAQGEMTQIETAIENYNSKMGHYPPDNAPNWAVNQLYFELLGTTNIGQGATVVYHTLDSSAQIRASDLGSAIGPNISGFVNCSKGGEDGFLAQNFLKSLKNGQFYTVTNTPSAPVSMALGMPSSTMPSPSPLQSPNSPYSAINPWCYNSSNPRYNPKSFDLWIDVVISGKTNRICNWSDKPIVVGTSY